MRIMVTKWLEFFVILPISVFDQVINSGIEVVIFAVVVVVVVGVVVLGFCVVLVVLNLDIMIGRIVDSELVDVGTVAIDGLVTVGFFFF